MTTDGENELYGETKRGRACGELAQSRPWRPERACHGRACAPRRPGGFRQGNEAPTNTRRIQGLTYTSWTGHQHEHSTSLVEGAYIHAALSP